MRRLDVDHLGRPVETGGYGVAPALELPTYLLVDLVHVEERDLTELLLLLLVTELGLAFRQILRPDRLYRHTRGLLCELLLALGEEVFINLGLVGRGPLGTEVGLWVRALVLPGEVNFELFEGVVPLWFHLLLCHLSLLCLHGQLLLLVRIGHLPPSELELHPHYDGSGSHKAEVEGPTFGPEMGEDIVVDSELEDILELDDVACMGP